MSRGGASRFRDLVEGERLGKLVVLSKGDDEVTYFLRCDCGRRITRRVGLLLGKDRVWHCGCVRHRYVHPPKRNQVGELVFPVAQASLLRQTADHSWWDVELECGHKILGLKKILSDPPQWAGCRKCTAQAEPHQEIPA